MTGLCWSGKPAGWGIDYRCAPREARRVTKRVVIELALDAEDEFQAVVLAGGAIPTGLDLFGIGGTLERVRSDPARTTHDPGDPVPVRCSLVGSRQRRQGCIGRS